MLNPNINYSIYEEKDSKLKSAIAYIDDFIECQLFYPIRETEIVLDINSGIKNL